MIIRRTKTSHNLSYLMRDNRGLGISLKGPEAQPPDMFAKLFFICALVVVAWGVEYPAGVHPAVCPNYPYCDMGVLARHTFDGTPIPEWVLNPSLLPVAPLPVDPIAVAPRYPADFNPALCPNYPYC